MKKIVTIAGGIIVLACIGLVVASHYFYNVSVARAEKNFFDGVQDTGEAAAAPVNPYEAAKTWLSEQDMTTVSLTSKDGIDLVGYYVKAEEETNKTAILAHGYASKGQDMAMFARIFIEAFGYNVLMPDARGHGASGGDYIGFGWHERLDYLQWIDYVIEEAGQESQIMLFGVSMGGATVMMTSGEDLPEQVKVIVEDCGYTSVEDELSYQLKEMYHLPKFPLIATTSLLTDIKSGYNFYQASAIEQVKKAQVPMLFIHGDADLFVPTYMGYEVYEACGSQVKDLYIVEGASHGAAYGVAGQDYVTTIQNFIQPYMN